MRALLIDGYAPIPSAYLDTRADARPGPGEALIRVEAAGLNPLDAKLAHGDMTSWFPLAFPYVPGTDFAGEVIEIGDRVSLTPSQSWRISSALIEASFAQLRRAKTA